MIDPPVKQIIWNMGGVFGPPKAGLKLSKVLETRELLKGYLEPQPEFLKLLEAKCPSFDASKTMALHLRLTDKVNSEAVQNDQLSIEDIVSGYS